jgi:hypothetical protein
MPYSLIFTVFSRWNPQHGRAFDMIMCELKRRLLDPNGNGKKIQIDTDACTIKCGDDKVVELIRKGG